MSDSPIKEDTQPVQTEAPPQPYYTYPGAYPPPPRRRGGGLGCWITGLVTAFLVMGLIVIGLFLPPISLGDRLFGEQYAMLNATSNATQTDDGSMKLIVNPTDPGREFGVRFDTVGLNEFLSGTQSVDWANTARASAPPYLALQSAVYTIETTGTAPTQTTLEVALPGSASPDVLDLYGWYAGSAQWRFIPSQVNSAGSLTARVRTVPDGVALFQASPLDPVVVATVDLGQTLINDVASLATIIAPAGMQPALPTTPQRTLVGNPAPGFSLSAGYRVMPIIRNFSDPRAIDPDTVVSIIGNRALRSEHVQQITAFASAGGYNGVFIDYRDLPADQRDLFATFITELAASLHDYSLLLGVVVPAAENVAGTWDTGAYDWRALGQAADYIEIDLGLDPTSFSPGRDRLVEAMLRWGVGEVSRYRLLAGLSARSLRQVAGVFTPVGFSEALSALGNVQLEVEQTEAGTVLPGSALVLSLDGFQAVPGVDTTVQSPFIEYLGADGAVTSRMWLTTAEALRFRMDRMTPFALAGVAFNDLLLPDLADGILDSILSYKTQTPGLVSQEEIALAWRIEGADGLVTEFITGFNEQLIVTLEAPDGNYAVNVDIISGQAASSRGGAAVALFAATATPTPPPTATPTPTPTPTATLRPVVATSAPAAGGGAPPAGGGGVAAPPPSGSIGNFEYGGHVTSTGSARAVNAMRSAGMTWMKVQIRYNAGGGTGAAADAINNARANGFRILLGIVGSPAELAAGGGGYIQQFAQYLGDVAALGPDAIEVWNEPNLWREWPEGQISGANYTAMLAAAYNAIKSRNGGVMVISGALAPTGAEGAFPGRVVNDDRFLQEMVNAGALQFMDCVGLHYNEGIIGPRQTSGDPRDSYYTRYFPLMLNTYWNITGGQRPICITELGYLTSEGYGPLPEFFAWAQNVTISQHAAWLAEAAAVAAQSGRVRLMIVWNVDFTNYGADPMAGYAMIRADGSCPACAAFAAAR